jgi:hypothetical protein
MAPSFAQSSYPTSSPTLSPTFSPSTSSPISSTPNPTTEEEWQWHNEYSGTVLSEYTAIVWGTLALVVYIYIKR